MDFYSLEDAIYLTQYYSDKLIGQILEKSTKSKVTHLEKEFIGDNKYRVVARGTPFRTIFYPKRDISLVVKDLGITFPDQVLKDRS